MLQTTNRVYKLARTGMRVAYDIKDDVLVVESDFGEYHAFTAENVEDLIDWLISDRKYSENWHNLEFRYRPSVNECVLVIVEDDGHLYDIFRFPQSEMTGRIKRIVGDLRLTLNEIILPVRRMKAEGVPDSEIFRHIENVRFQDLPLIWQSSENDQRPVC